MPKPKILYLSNSARIGGMEVHLLNLVAGMVSKGYEVFVICPWGEMVEKYFAAGANIRIGHPRLDIDPFYIFRLIKFLRQNQIEILHVHQLKTVINGLAAAKIASVPLKIAHIHTPLSQWKIPRIKKTIDILVNRVVTNLCADKVIALTEATKQERIRGEGINPEKIVVIPNGVDVENVKCQMSNVKTKERLVIGTLGRLTVEKGQRLLIEAMPKILEKAAQLSNCPTVKLLIAGDGPLRAELEDQVRNLGIEDRVSFLGSISGEEKVDYLASLDIFVFPSLAEGFGIALIEAMACGLPCVVSDLPVLREVTDGGRCALLFKAGDSDDLARQIVRLLEDEDLRRRLGQKARKRVEREYSMERFIDAYDALYSRS